MIIFETYDLFFALGCRSMRGSATTTSVPQCSSTLGRGYCWRGGVIPLTLLHDCFWHQHYWRLLENEGFSDKIINCSITGIIRNHGMWPPPAAVGPQNLLQFEFQRIRWYYSCHQMCVFLPLFSRKIKLEIQCSNAQFPQNQYAIIFQLLLGVGLNLWWRRNGQATRELWFKRPTSFKNDVFCIGGTLLKSAPAYHMRIWPYFDKRYDWMLYSNKSVLLSLCNRQID